ncbi:MAG: hypothetical protein HYS07_04430 [Chlamydiae bacterium]|nr:hypothetical protein [Chlamydiota bacterium]MBI3277446.1 hypothetical protein [Chlamydiota bacterium]
MSSDITPEEKLLKLIKEGRGEAKPENLSGKESAETLPIPLPKRDLSRKSSSINSVKPIKILSFSCSGLVIFLISILGYQYLIGEPIFPLPIRKIPSSESLELPSNLNQQAESFDTYSKILEKRDIFKTIGPPPPVMTPTERSVGLSELVKNLSLSGIIPGDQPEGIVEDKSNGQVYYVKSGDRIGQLEVVEVTEGSLLLRYRDEEGQLTL